MLPPILGLKYYSSSGPTENSTNISELPCTLHAHKIRDKKKELKPKINA
jgi:hypothetical protein